MSGICGVFQLDDSPARADVLGAMMAAARHRSPDGAGRWISGTVALANLRTNITPESARESQPQSLRCDAVILTASARIDNRSDLIPVLAAAGSLRVADPTDADLILAAYDRWGRSCASFLIGDFAFAIWDASRRAIFASRDPMGFRPLYYRAEERRFLFASEVKQILAVEGVTPSLFEPAVATHLAMADLLSEWTFFDGVFQLPAGSSLWCDRSGVKVWRHWDPDPKQTVRYRSEDEYAEHFREIFKEAVRARLRSSKPVGVWLSGGLDSGSVAATAGWLRQQPASAAILAELHAYSWAFDSNPECDERYISDGIVRHFDLPATYVSMDEAPPLSSFPAGGTDADAPLVQVYTPLLHRALEIASRQGVHSILSGFRGDALMASGTFDYLDMVLRGRLGTVCRHLRHHSTRSGIPLSRAVNRQVLLPMRSAIAWAPAISWVTHPIRELVRPHKQAYPAWVESEFAERVELKRIVNRPPARTRSSGVARSDRERRAFHPLFMRAAVEQELHNSKFGIGYADPWSDRRLLEFVLAIPPEFVSRVSDEKRLTRVAMQGVMPEKTRMALRKTIPSPVYERALRQDSREKILRLIDESRLAARGFVDGGRLRRYYDSYLRGTEEDPRFWFTLTAEMWLRRHWS